MTAVTPLNNATGVATNTKTITAAFSKEMDPASLNADQLYAGLPCRNARGRTCDLSDGRQHCDAYVAGSARIFQPVPYVRPGLPPRPGTRLGIPLATDFVWTFTTGAAPDVTAPTVTSTVPAAGATGVALNSLITASFSEPMNPATITAANFTLECPAATFITGAVSYAVNGNVATFAPAAALPASTVCRATITTGVQDTAGNAMAANFVWTFTTGASPDTTAPTVTSTVPAAGAVGVARNSLITASFSEPMNPLTITTANFSVECPAATFITGTVTYAQNGNVATFAPTANLPASTLCRATISSNVRDTAGNPMATNFVWTFTTGAATDTTAPTVTGTNPANAAVGQCRQKSVNATFSEPMDPLTINTATFTLECPVATADRRHGELRAERQHRDLQSDQRPPRQHHLYCHGQRRPQRGQGPGRQCACSRQRHDLYHQCIHLRYATRARCGRTFRQLSAATRH